MVLYLMRSGLRQFWWALLLLCLPGWVQAATAPSPANLNTATVPVASQSAADLHAALVEAFSQVLIKVTGDSHVITVPSIQQQLATVEKFVQKYNYLDGYLQVSFDQRALISLLAHSQQLVWLAARPSTLVWLSVNNQPPLTVAAENPDPLAIVLEKNASLRGIPLYFPVMDAVDQAAWQNKTTLSAIAAHYQVPAILSGTLTGGAGAEWTVDWSLIWRDQTWQWHGSGVPETLLAAAVNKVADIMGEQLAVSLDQLAANQVWLAIWGINRLSDYQAALNALKHCTPVLGVFVQDVGSQGVLLQVTTVGEGADSLKTALGADSHFVPLAGNAAANGVLSYRWQP